MKAKAFLLLFFIFLLGLFLRIYYIYPEQNIILGYDQVGDLIQARKIINYHDLIVKGTISSTTGINHGVIFSYFTAIPYY